ncbi:hypothetical protein FNL55_19460 [Tardiphaga sp. vice352]|uniref:hypothetical protein n=1 Tax=Tardiphaga sp. vice352 TaxID=2592816 RepID=UPI0011625098|nr:hypothetical protein [Tardiphaga sp. vice352]QDM33292.1 hypothetical protein FNL55_19460 [Tardiphaga sp. vice352]
MNIKPTIPYLTKQLAMPENIVPFVKEAVLLLPGEEEAHFLQLFSMTTIDLDPQNNLEWFMTIDAACLLWDMQRYRGWKNASIALHHSSAVGEALMQTHPGFLALGYNETIHAAVRVEHEAWRKDPAAADELRTRLDAMGYTQDGLLATAFARAAETIVRIEQLMASCRRQFSRLVNEAIVRKEFRIRAHRFAKKQQAKNVSDLSQKSAEDGV